MGGFLFAVAPGPGLGTSPAPAQAPTSEHARADVWDHVIPVNSQSGGERFFKKGLYFFRCLADNPCTQGYNPPARYRHYENDENEASLRHGMVDERCPRTLWRALCSILFISLRRSAGRMGRKRSTLSRQWVPRGIASIGH